MNQGSDCLRCLKTQVLTSSAGSESRVFSVLGNREKDNACSTKRATKVKRWKTKKERNNAKYKSHQETFQKKAFPRGYLQRCNMKPSSGGLNMGPQTTLKDTCNLKKVFITHSRLTQHQGIFNREVKSIDIGRLVNQTAEVEPTKTDIGNVTTHTGKTPQGQMSLNLDLIPTPELKDQVALDSPSNCPPEMLAQIPTPVSNAQWVKEVECSELRPQEDNSHPHVALPGSGTRTSPPDMQVAPIEEAVEDILNMLSSRSLFHGRNLVSETRQSIVEKMRQLSGSNAGLSQVPVHRELDCKRTADVHRYKDPEDASDRHTDVRKSGQRPHSTNRQMHTPPIHRLPLLRDSPAHTLIKMVGSEDQQKITDDFHQPVKYGPGYKYLQRAEEDSKNMFNFTSVSNPKLSNRDRNSTSFFRAQRTANIHSPSINDGSPPVRWSIGQDDFQTRIARQHIHFPKVTERPSVDRQPFQDACERMSKAGRLLKDSSTFDVHHSTWRCTAHNSPDDQIFDVSPAETRLHYMESVPHRTLSRSNIQAGRPVFPEMLEDTCLVAPDNFQFEDVQSFRNPKRHTSSQLVADTGFHQDAFPTRNMSTWRNFQESRNGDLSLRVDPIHTMRNSGDTERSRHKDWSNEASRVQNDNQQRRTTVMYPYSQTSQQETSFVSLPYGRSLRKTQLENSSTDTWLYPRMRLY